MYSSWGIGQQFLEFDGKFYPVDDNDSLAQLGRDWYQSGKPITLNGIEYRAHWRKNHTLCTFFKALFASIWDEKAIHENKAKQLAEKACKRNKWTRLSLVFDLAENLVAPIHSLFLTVKTLFFTPPPLEPLRLKCREDVLTYEGVNGETFIEAKEIDGPSRSRLFLVAGFISDVITCKMSMYILPMQIRHVLFDTHHTFRFIDAYAGGVDTRRHGDVAAQWSKLCRMAFKEHGGYVSLEGQVYNLRYHPDYTRFALNFARRGTCESFREIYRLIPAFSAINKAPTTLAAHPPEDRIDLRPKEFVFTSLNVEEFNEVEGNKDIKTDSRQKILSLCFNILRDHAGMVKIGEGDEASLYDIRNELGYQKLVTALCETTNLKAENVLPHEQVLDHCSQVLIDQQQHTYIWPDGEFVYASMARTHLLPVESLSMKGMCLYKLSAW